jgi:hypothetical protein
MKQKLLKIIIVTFLISINAYANKFDIMAGMYSFNGSANGKSSALSGFGVYEISYLQPFFNHFEANLGYSFTMTNVIGGDYSYGPKLGLNYFPFNFSSNEKILLNNKSIEVQDFYRPYVGIAFNQRQYQSAKTSYAGFGFSVGCEKYINEKFTLKSEVKLNSYTGASNATASEINILAGLVFNY